MNKKKQKSSTGVKIAAVIFAIIDCLLLAAGVFVVIRESGSGEKGTVTIDREFESNVETYYEKEPRTIEIDEKLKIQNKDASTLTESLASPSPSPSPTPAPAEAENNGFVFPDSGNMLITDAQMNEKLTSSELCRRAINEIYARRGYQFSNQEILAYFNQFSWYQILKKEPDMAKVEATFSSVEKSNVEKLQAFRTAHNWN